MDPKGDGASTQEAPPIRLDRHEKKSLRRPDDYTALMNWETHDEVRDSETTELLVALADLGIRVADIEDLMKAALRRKLEELSS
jgi:hypothetical protein